MTMAELRAILTKHYELRLPRIHDKRHALHFAHDHLHIAYFSGVFYKAVVYEMSFYGLMAGGLLVCSVLAVVMKEQLE